MLLIQLSQTLGMLVGLIALSSGTLRGDVTFKTSVITGRDVRPDDYAPENAQCPAGSLIRQADSISNAERDFVRNRQRKTNQALGQFFARNPIDEFDSTAFLESYSPTIGLSFSGGGYRAMLVGAGELKALDGRTPGTDEGGQLGELLQSATYMAGLSGGSWLLGSVVVNNFATIGDLQSSQSVWQLENSILAPDGARIRLNDDYYDAIRTSVDSKKDAGFNTTITDVWGRALATQFIDLPNGGPGVTWSSVTNMDSFKNADMPFPIIVADGRNPGELFVGLNSTVYEFNPYELGSFDPTLFAFTSLQFIGSSTNNGTPTNNASCIEGFDDAGFVMGTSSSLFNQALLHLDSADLRNLVQHTVNKTLTSLSEQEVDIADYSPNPFFGVNPTTNPTAGTSQLFLVDGGEDLQNIPFQPLLQPQRALDVIFAFDNSADTVRSNGSLSNWPNGTAMVATYQRSLTPIANGTGFPTVPDTTSFVNLGLNNRPTFFGCDSSNFTTQNSSTIPPLIVYIPNTPWTYQSNTSTGKITYTDAERDAMISNGWSVATQGNSTDWAKCVGCAIVHREMERRKTPVRSCDDCMKQYCWDGRMDPIRREDYEPKMEVESGAAGRMMKWGILLMAVFISCCSGWMD